MTSSENGKSKSSHEAQWERQGEWLVRLRAKKQELEAQGIQGFDLLEAMATLSIDHKEAIQRDRCSACWHDQYHCICDRLKPLVDGLNTETTTLPNVKLCILMHHKEYLGAGNSAKLLWALLPQHTELYLFGKRGEVDRLFRDISKDNAMILWPGEDAISVSQFMATTNPTRAEKDGNSSDTTHSPILRAIVLDGTYTQARHMHKSLRKRWGKEHMPAAVALNPTCSSVFHRAQKSYGEAHKDYSKVLRVSTAEACGLFLTELGASESIEASITKAVVLNNQALGFARTSGRNCD